jgi:hypothetical protein
MVNCRSPPWFCLTALAVMIRGRMLPESVMLTRAFISGLQENMVLVTVYLPLEEQLGNSHFAEREVCFV